MTLQARATHIICSHTKLREFEKNSPTCCIKIYGIVYWLVSFTHAAQPPKITSQPSSLETALPSMCEHGFFAVEATGTEPLSYQWQWKSKPDEDWQNVCDRSRLKLSGIQPSSIAQQYRCVVSNSAGSATSEIAYLIAGN